MRRLSKTASKYISKNKLEGFLVKGLLPREISAKVNLYHKSCVGSYFRYPDNATFAKMKKFEYKHQRRITLKKIKYSIGRRETHLRGIQLLFSDGFASQFFDSPFTCCYQSLPDNYSEELYNKDKVRSIQVHFDENQDAKENRR